MFMVTKTSLALFTRDLNKLKTEITTYSNEDIIWKVQEGIEKLIHWVEKGMTMEPAKSSIDLKIDGIIRSIPLGQILHIQSLGNYVKIFLDNKVLITQITTKELEDDLPKSSFIRIHKSFIVNKSKIDQVQDDELMIGDNRLPIGKTFKKYVKEFIAVRH